MTVSTKDLYRKGDGEATKLFPNSIAFLWMSCDRRRRVLVCVYTALQPLTRKAKYLGLQYAVGVYVEKREDFT
jgi:hypothetical protein